VTCEAARTALLAYRRQNFPVDPDNHEMIQKYIEMRSKWNRVTGDAFMRYLETGEETQKAGRLTNIAYWAVPKKNFPQGLPKNIQPGQIDEDNLDDGASVEFDRENYLLIDQRIPRDALGKGVWSVTAYYGSEGRFNTSQPSKTLKSSATGGKKSHRPQLEDTSDDDTQTLGRAIRAVALKQRPSDVFKDSLDTDQADNESLFVTQARLIKFKQTLITLKSNIDAAKAAGIWVTNNRLANDSVLFWVEETIGALEEMHTDASINKQQTEAIARRFVSYFVQLVQDSDAYPDWVAFKGLLPRMIRTCGSTIDTRYIHEATLLNNLANTNPEEAVAVDVAGAAVLVRADFYNSMIYRSYVQHMMQTALVRAQKATRNEERIAALQLWEENAQGTPEFQNTFKHAVCMFDPGMDLSDRILYLVTNELFEMALHWDATGHMGVAAQFCKVEPNLAKASISYDVFKKVAIAFNEIEELLDRIREPLIKNAVALVDEFAEPKFERILMHCVHARLHLKIPEDVAEPDVEHIQAIETGDLTFVNQRVMAFFKKVMRCDLPPWVTCLQEKHNKSADELSCAWRRRWRCNIRVGATVLVSFGRGDKKWLSNPWDQKKGKVTEVFRMECLVEMIEGDEAGNSRRFKTSSLKLVAERPAAAGDAPASP